MIYSTNTYLFKVNDRDTRKRFGIASTLSKKTTKCPAKIYLFKVSNRNTRKKYEICSKLTIKTPEWRHRRRSGIFIVNFEHISHFFLVFLLLTLKK